MIDGFAFDDCGAMRLKNDEDVDYASHYTVDASRSWLAAAAMSEASKEG